MLIVWKIGCILDEMKSLDRAGLKVVLIYNGMESICIMLVLEMRMKNVCLTWMIIMESYEWNYESGFAKIRIWMDKLEIRTKHKLGSFGLQG